MILNRHQLDEKGIELAEMIEFFFIKEKIGEIDAYVNFSKFPKVEFKNELVRIEYWIKPEEQECEEQLQIPTIFFEESIRRTGLFIRLMKELISFCKRYNDMPIIFLGVVSEYFSDLLMRHGGQILSEEFDGKYFAVLPENWK
ncbi:hypothetical protein [Bacillus sp. MRMR6]|uniref:hypothetical protein n=1 Tax=Bacillus sp. MRMR6 TaxID=1928617 RepID=UPI000951EF9D|nr:hypothetical protein [Bacillus sp. MRMR6]OLS36217.1 hypothetical protein BTR25_18435 [Bacillus sp. MRMR6]